MFCAIPHTARSLQARVSKVAMIKCCMCVVAVAFLPLKSSGHFSFPKLVCTHQVVNTKVKFQLPKLGRTYIRKVCPLCKLVQYTKSNITKMYKEGKKNAKDSHKKQHSR